MRRSTLSPIKPALAGVISASRRPDDASVLLTEPFAQWCRGLRIKTENGIESFDLFDWQDEFIDLLLNNPKIPISLLSSRQTGKSAVILALLVWLSLSRFEFTAVVTHRKGDDVRQLARRCKKFIPDGVRLESDSLSLIEFRDTGSQLHFRSCNPKAEDGAEAVGRGLASVDLIVIEEASHTSNVQDVMRVIGPTLTHSPMKTVLQIGTASRKESYYYGCLRDAFGGTEPLENTLSGIRAGTIEPFHVERGEKRIAVITNWRAIPRFRDEGFDEDGRPNYLKRIEKEQDLSESQVNSEHELIFDSDTTQIVFEFTDVMKAQGGQWEPAKEGGVYFAGVDGSGKPKPGRKGDFTVCIVLKKEKEIFRVVALYRRRGITFQRRYKEMSELLNGYDPLQTLVEANDGLGQTYEENLCAACPKLDIERFNNNNQRKALLINKIQLALEKEELKIPKSPIIDELLGFQLLEDGTMGAIGKDAHDDTVIALGLALVAAQYGV